MKRRPPHNQLKLISHSYPVENTLKYRVPVSSNASNLRIVGCILNICLGYYRLQLDFVFMWITISKTRLMKVTVHVKLTNF
jgi:hypothetical protein